jgi:thymidylate kinase
MIKNERKSYHIFAFLFCCLFLWFNHAIASQNIIRIGFEGMPGAGKTSSLVSLAREMGEGGLFLPEINIEEDSFSDQHEDAWKIYHHLWKERLSTLEAAKCELLVFMDRTYFSNLAFTYAVYDRKYSDEYEMQKKMIKEDFQNSSFDLIFFFDISPELGLQRRNKQGDFPDYPWSNLSFLKKLRGFYHKELPKLYHGEIIYLSTETLNPEQLFKLIDAEITKRFKGKLTKSQVQYNNNEEEALLLDYAKLKNLGAPYSRGFYVRGFPSIYFRQFAIQLEGQNVFILNNSRLRQILGGENECNF